MGAPKNYSHITPQDIQNDRKHHLTITEMLNTSLIPSIYTTVNSNSATWNNVINKLDIADFNNYSGSIYSTLNKANSVYSTVQIYSGGWGGGVTGDYLSLATFNQYSGNIEPSLLKADSVYSIVENNSAIWNITGSPLTGNYIETTIFKQYSGNIEPSLLKADSVYSIVNSNSGFWQTSYKTIYIDSGSMIPRITNGPSLGTTETSNYKIMNDYFDFDATTNEYAQFKLVMPDEWDRGTIKAKFYWTNSSTAGTGSVIWGIHAGSIANDIAIDTILGTAQTVSDAFITAGDMHITSTTSSITIANTQVLGNMIYFEVYRDATNDNYTQDARLLGVEIQYKELISNSISW